MFGSILGNCQELSGNCLCHMKILLSHQRTTELAVLHKWLILVIGSQGQLYQRHQTREWIRGHSDISHIVGRIDFCLDKLHNHCGRKLSIHLDV